MSTYSAYADLNITAGSDIHPAGESFVRGALQAWGEHLHLVIRPEEVWFTILVQMNFYMNANAEELRHLFVDHQGQKVIYVEDFTWYAVLRRFQFEIQALVKTDWLLDWIRPNFTTTTENDIMTANVLMMGLTKAYFRFEGGIVCGLPSVTLLGEQADWAALLKKLDRFTEFGFEPSAYAKRLRPILSRFVKSFVEPDSAATRSFWNSIVVARSVNECGAPPLFLSGWITGFFFWNDRGQTYGHAASKDMVVELDGLRYPQFDIMSLPVGYARAPFIMHDFGNMDRFPAYVGAGTIGKRISPGAPPGFAEALKRAGGNMSWAENKGMHSTLQPLSAWMLYGPVDHNNTSTAWQREPELGQIAGGTRSLMSEMTCKAVY
jgi:hypothetical protein